MERPVRQSNPPPFQTPDLPCFRCALCGEIKPVDPGTGPLLLRMLNRNQTEGLPMACLVCAEAVFGWVLTENGFVHRSDLEQKETESGH